MFRNIDFSKISMFLTAAEKLNFSEAANQLYITQSSLSKSIASFESAIGFPLFTRGNRRVTLTAEGEYLYRELSRIMCQTEQVFTIANQMREGYTGCFRIGVSGYMPKTPVFERICSEFTLTYPNFEIELVHLPYTEVRKSLMDASVDAVLFNQEDLSGVKGLQTICLAHGETILLCNPHIPLPGPDYQLTLAQFQNHKFVCMNATVSRNYYEYLQRSCLAYGFQPNIVRYTASLVETVHYVSTLNYVTVLDRTLFPMRDSDLKAVPVSHKEGMIRYDTVLAWREELDNIAFKHFTALAKDILEEMDLG